MPTAASTHRSGCRTSQSDPEAAETYRRLASFLADEERAGLPRPEAVEKLVKETAFTHLNRLVAFKMMEARKLIRGTLDKGTESMASRFTWPIRIMPPTWRVSSPAQPTQPTGTFCSGSRVRWRGR